MIKKKRIFFVFLLGLFLFSGVVSAGFFSDSWENIKGAITGYSATGCRDSDGGIKPFVFGYTYGSSAGGMMDHCLNSHFLQEAFCTSTGGISSKVIECEYGCNAGKCNTKEECEGAEGCKLNKNYCLDEDLGDYFEKGDLYLVRAGWYDNGSDLFSYRGTDYCRDSNWLTEYICQPTGRDARKFVVCPDGCFDGACMKGEKYLEAQRANCTDSFQGPHGMERLFVKGTVSYDGKIYEDVCASKGILTEYSCDYFGLLKKANTGCVHGCEDGVCLKSPSNPEPSTSEKSEENVSSGEEGLGVGDSCENESECTYSGERYCEGNISFVCGYFDMDKCLDVKWSNCPGRCEEGVCIVDSDEGKFDEEDGETQIPYGGFNLIANNFRIINRNLEKVILLEFEEEGLSEGDEYYVSFSYSLDRGTNFEGEVLIPRDLLGVEGFGVYSNAEYFEPERVTIVTLKANMNVPYRGNRFEDGSEEITFEDNCIQQSFRISDSLLYRGEKDVVPLRDFKRCEGEGISNLASSSSDFPQHEGSFEEECFGCFLNGDCYLFGELLEDKYCSPISLNFERRLEFRERCQEDYQCISGLCGEDERCSKRISLNLSSCFNGCPLNGFCYGVGSRENNLFCSGEGFFIPTKSEGSSCNASYECSSNFCHKEECISPNLFHRLLRDLGVYPKI